ncbi:hypothetical protein [Serratia aquatilis]|uniref:Uncharacterized protein n=1 Tax=Serratia aquatilis TaxID=1737515 RepID=A0ABV6EJ59_9GAMM
MESSGGLRLWNATAHKLLGYRKGINREQELFGTGFIQLEGIARKV